MNYYFTLFTLTIVSSANVRWGPGHNTTREKQILNAKIKEQFPEILVITSPGSYYHLRRTLVDIFEGLFTQFDYLSLNRLLILNRLKGFVVRSKGDQGLESNLLTPLLLPPEYKQAGEFGHRENIYDFMGDLANRYVDLLKEEVEEIKEIHVVPIAKVPNESNLDTSRPVFLFGVLGKRKGSDNLIGMAGLIVEVK